MPSEREIRNLYVNGRTICIEVFFCFLKFFSVRRTRSRHRMGTILGAWGGSLNKHFPQTGTRLLCLPILSRIRDKSGYTESWIIPKPYFSACFHVGSVKKIRDNFSSLLSCFQYFFIGSFPTFGIIL